ncbi:MAG: prepilin peptidase [Candidatus Melainabacteria bacterium]|nr:prepilin peptidase [Candidatus Melainabacteria bacterium]
MSIMSLFSFEFLISGSLIFVIASCLGSFFKVVVDRYESNESFIFRPSCCFHCKKNLSWWQNIPIVSFLLLGGRCFFCKTKIDVYCFYSEVVTAFAALAVFVAGWTKNDCYREITVALVFTMVLILLSMFDLKHRIIPHTITYSAIIFILISRFFLHRETLYLSFAHLGIAFIFMDLLYFFSTLIKRFKLNINLVSIPLIIWLVFFHFNQSIYFIFIPLISYFLLAKLKINSKLSMASWLILLLVLLYQFYKLFFLEHNIEKLHFLFTGVGIIYFVCEILIYFFNSFSNKDKEEVSQPDNTKVTIGGGDITVFALISVFLGFKTAFLTLFIASFLAIISHFTIRAVEASTKSSKEKHSQYIPFVPFLSVACFIIMITI